MTVSSPRQNRTETVATKHLQMTIGFARDQVRADIADGRYPRLLQNSDGTVPTIEQITAFLDEIEADGFEVVPCGCSEIDDKGRCLGTGR